MANLLRLTLVGRVVRARLDLTRPRVPLDADAGVLQQTGLNSEHVFPF